MNMKNKFFFEIVSSYKEQDINLPKRQTIFSAGYDFESAVFIVIKPKEIVLVPTGVKACFASNKVLCIYPRSSLSLKKKLTMPNNVGIIDSDYYNNKSNEGHIFIPLYNFSDENVFIQKKERIAQGILQEFFLTQDDFVEKDKIRQSGFGSTDND
ncbi:deoxyuridine 5'-triphosphate nucleotidohydrolase [Candidatus Phytoplasma luffae]|uniref:dUTP diphosphatase n=1 Tax=Loofah witches'-broom phytoplasma TaxID=35773 RepID=A0A975IM52_LOWBP|nr:dUTP diphosphatase [Candidatus Phytoplasma luffae]QTX03142.1 deoxyuridine 5'-triphosphate nucleotidohydrolase [Candidatus Phytoplasma luffae]